MSDEPKKDLRQYRQKPVAQGRSGYRVVQAIFKNEDGTELPGPFLLLAPNGNIVAVCVDKADAFANLDKFEKDWASAPLDDDDSSPKPPSSPSPG